MRKQRKPVTRGALKEYEQNPRRKKKRGRKSKKMERQAKNKAPEQLRIDRSLSTKAGAFLPLPHIMLAQRQGEGKIKGRCDA